MISLKFSQSVLNALLCMSVVLTNSPLPPEDLITSMISQLLNDVKHILSVIRSACALSPVSVSGMIADNVYCWAGCLIVLV